jgi:hypothetical protein
MERFCVFLLEIVQFMRHIFEAQVASKDRLDFPLAKQPKALLFGRTEILQRLIF